MVKLVRSYEFWLVMAIVALATFFRVYQPYVAEFKFDEAMISRRAIALAEHGIWPASTSSSIVGIPHPPMKALLLAIPYAFTRNPAVAVIFQGVLGVITVFLTYWYCRRYFDLRVALIASALVAVTPWVVFYDRKLWSQNVPIFTMLMMFSLTLFVIEKKLWAIVVTLASLGFLIGCYTGDIALIGVVAPALVLYWPSSSEADSGWAANRKYWIALMLGVLAFVVTILPFGIEFVSGRANLFAAETSYGQFERVIDFYGQARMAAVVGTGEQYHSLAGEMWHEYYASLPLPEPVGWLDSVLVNLTLISIVYIAWKAIVTFWDVDQRRSVSVRYGVLALWFIAPVTIWSLLGLPVLSYRYIMITPLQGIALAIMIVDTLDWIIRQKQEVRVPAWIVVSLLLAFTLIWHVIQIKYMIDFLYQHPGVGGSGPPLWKMWETAERARQTARAEDLPVVVYAGGDDPEYQGHAAEWEVLLGDTDLYLINADKQMSLSSSSGVVEVFDANNNTYLVQLQPAAEPDNSPGLARLANGVDLVSFEPTHLTQQDLQSGVLNVTLKWRIWNDAPLAQQYGYSVQLYTGDGAPVNSLDLGFARSVYWRDGDIYITRLEFKLQPGSDAAPPDRFIVAMYAYLNETTIQAIDVLDIAGNPAGQQIVIPLTLEK
jgi:4-amino-4-deoxy-L-arabinose transferase-like glycosyltransferase